MNTIQSRLAVPIPRALRSRPLDSRGYPVPFVTLIDRTGLPQFTINDAERVAQCRRNRLCSLCGKRLVDGLWFIGGPRCFTHEFGAFVDPPNHYKCAEYALKVCPFLAARSYATRIDLAKMSDASYGEGIAIVMHNAMPPAQPELFGLGQCHDCVISPHGLYVVSKWQYVEWWKGGLTVNAPAEGNGT